MGVLRPVFSLKPDLCAPGEHIVASWPDDVPLGDDGDSFFVPYNVLSGTSFATPLVAAGLAMIKAEKNFSVSATISAAITTANKMHGKDLAFEFAYGAGEFNLKKARQPGLVYEEKNCIFERFYLSDGEDPPYFHLNLPYFSATFPPHCEEKWAIKFSRKLRSVEKGRSTYTAKIEIHSSTMRMPTESISISVVPKILEFDDMDCEQQFTLNVSLPNTKYYEWSFGVISGSLIWTKNADKEDQRTVVDSPILLSSRHVPSRPVGVYPSSC